MFASLPMLNLLVIKSSDIEKALSFYSNMGICFDKHSHGNGPVHYCYVNEHFVFEIYELKENDVPTTSARFGFSVDDVDECIKVLEKDGVEIVSYPKDSQWGRRAVVKDFDGHTIELLSPSING